MGVGSNAEIGGGAVLAVLELLADPPALKGRIAELYEAEQRANAAMAAVGPAHEVLALRADAERMKTAAMKQLDEAGSKAMRTLQDAEDRAEEILKNAQDEAAATSAAASKLSNEAHEAMAAVKAREADYEAATAELEQARAKVEKTQARLNDELAEVALQREQLLAEKQRLATIAEQMRGAI